MQEAQSALRKTRGKILLERFIRERNLHLPTRMNSRLFPAVLAAVLFLISCGNRANPAPKPQQPPPPPFEFQSAWGDKGDGPGKLNAPVSFAVDALGDVYFA